MTKRSAFRRLGGGVFLAVAIGGLGCGDSVSDGGASGQASQTTASVSGPISVDGSSTVEPISAAIAEEFDRDFPDVEPTVAASGTGGGFKKFCNGETDITGASRPIKAEEIEACKLNNIEFVEVPVAFDGLSVVINPANTWAENLTVAELKKIWEPGSKVDNWSQVRPGFPNAKILLYGAGTDSGTFDYFTAAIVGKERASRPDYQASEDDNTLVQGVKGDKNALGYFGYAYYEQNKDTLKVVAVDGVKPSPQTIGDGSYKPLSRPLFYYVSVKALEAKPQVGAFMNYLLTQGKEIIPQTGYIPLPDEVYSLGVERLNTKTTGTIFHGTQTGMRLQDMMKGK